MFASLLEQIALGLEARGIPYMLIGGQAVLLYGEPRLTRDIDITLGVGPERLADIQEMAATWGWQALVDAAHEFVQRTLVFPCQDPRSGIRVDFIFSFSPYERQALERVRRVPIGSAKVCFASLEDTLIHKIVAGRPRDLEDARSIVLKNPDLDAAYVRRWLGEFERSLDQPYRRIFEEILASAQVQ